MALEYYWIDLDGGINHCDSADEAKSKAEEQIDVARDESVDGWPEDVTGVEWGVVCEDTQIVSSRRVEAESSLDEVVDYGLRGTGVTEHTLLLRIAALEEERKELLAQRAQATADANESVRQLEIARGDRATFAGCIDAIAKSLGVDSCALLEDPSIARPACLVSAPVSVEEFNHIAAQAAEAAQDANDLVQELQAVKEHEGELLLRVRSQEAVIEQQRAQLFEAKSRCADMGQRAHEAEKNAPLCDCGRIATCIGSSEAGIACCCEYHEDNDECPLCLQAELDDQRRHCEELEAENERLTYERDVYKGNADALAKRLEDTLHNAETLTDALTRERDAARAALMAKPTPIIIGDPQGLLAELQSRSDAALAKLAQVQRVIGKLRDVESCPAAKFEAQTCHACITARWAGRELRRILEGESNDRC